MTSGEPGAPVSGVAQEGLISLLIFIFHLPQGSVMSLCWFCTQPFGPAGQCKPKNQVPWCRVLALPLPLRAACPHQADQIPSRPPQGNLGKVTPGFGWQCPGIAATALQCCAPQPEPSPAGSPATAPREHLEMNKLCVCGSKCKTNCRCTRDQVCLLSLCLRIAVCFCFKLLLF